MYGNFAVTSSGTQTMGTTLPAQLYYWTNPSGNFNYDPYDYNQADTSIGSGAEAWNGYVIDNPDNPTPAGSTAKTDTTFSWAAYFVWQGQSPPPTPADFLLVTTVAASTGANVPDSDVGAMSTASDVFGETESSVYPGWASQNNVMTRRHLVRASVSEQVGRYMATVTLTGRGSAQVANSSTVFPNYHSVTVSGDGYVGGGALPDTRDVSISSDIDPTFRKGYKYDASGNDTYDQWGNIVYAPIINLRDDTGTMRGDVGLGDLPPGSNPPWTQSITYTANRSGDWHSLGSYYNWYSSLTGTSASAVLGQNLIDITDIPSFVVGYDRPINYTDANGTNYYPGQIGQDHIHLTYSDADQSYGGDSAVGTANYFMTTHLSYENPFKFRPDEYSYQDVPLDQPVPTAYSNLDATVQVSGYEPGAFTDGSIIEGDEWKFAFNAASGWLQGILQVSGLTQDSLSPQPFSKSVDFYGVWNSHDIDATWDGSPSPPPGADPGTYGMTPRVQAIMRDSYVRADHYAMPGDPSGYTGFAGQREQHFKAISSTQGQIGLRGTGDFHTLTSPPFSR